MAISPSKKQGLLRAILCVVAHTQRKGLTITGTQSHQSTTCGPQPFKQWHDWFPVHPLFLHVYPMCDRMPGFPKQLFRGFFWACGLCVYFSCEKLGRKMATATILNCCVCIAYKPSCSQVTSLARNTAWVYSDMYVESALNETISHVMHFLSSVRKGLAMNSKHWKSRCNVLNHAWSDST